jgi:hypothetical protein
MTKTENLQLPQWEAEDYVQRSDFNDAFQALDEGYALAVGSASKAWEASADKVTQEALAQLQTVVDTKAGQDDLTALTAQHTSDFADVQEALALRGNCQFVSGSYVGTGTYGSSNPVTLTFDHEPVVLFIGSIFLTRTKTKNYYEGSSEFKVTFKNNTVSWYNTGSASTQYNTSGTTYSYLAILNLEN